MGKTCLFITDHFLSKINGISLFSQNFIENYLKKKYFSIIIFEFNSEKLYYINADKSETVIDDVYVNAHYSRSDGFFRAIMKNPSINPFRFKLAPEFSKIIISHGWIKIKFRNHYYYYYYCLKNIFRSRNLKRIKFYDKILFISTISDNYRHKDFLFAKAEEFPIKFYDFKNVYINHIKESIQPINGNSANNYLLIITNLELVKNVFSIFYSKRFKSFMRRIKVNKIVILTPPNKKPIYKLFKFLCQHFSIDIVNDNNNKLELLRNSSCLYIPSITEYLPLVSLEAIAFEKDIYSRYKIATLDNYLRYSVITK